MGKSQECQESSDVSYEYPFKSRLNIWTPSVRGTDSKTKKVNSTKAKTNFVSQSCVKWLIRRSLPAICLVFTAGQVVHSGFYQGIMPFCPKIVLNAAGNDNEKKTQTKNNELKRLKLLATLRNYRFRVNSQWIFHHG